MVRAGGRALLRYVCRPDAPPEHSPKPYLHPVRTLAGATVTDHGPEDHPWHQGIAMTVAHLSGQNFWGGPTFDRHNGYVQRDNNGRIEQRGWTTLDADGRRAELAHRLDWIASDGRRLLAEDRTLTVADVDPEAGAWTLAFATRLTNVAGGPLRFGSPTTEGRPLAGYGGLFWRGPARLTGGTVLAGDGSEGTEVMGRRAPWLALVAPEGAPDPCTLVFVDDARNPRYPTPWFVRSEPFAAVSFAFSFHEELELADGAELRLAHHVIVADGRWGRAFVERAAAQAEAAGHRNRVRFEHAAAQAEAAEPRDRDRDERAGSQRMEVAGRPDRERMKHAIAQAGGAG